jgi:hypothetical protein
VYLLAIGYAVGPVWGGLIATDLLAPQGRELFQPTVATLLISLTGHLVYGAILAAGYLCSRSLEVDWPLRLTVRLQPRRALVPVETGTPHRVVAMHDGTVRRGSAEEGPMAA